MYLLSTQSTRFNLWSNQSTRVQFCFLFFLFKQDRLLVYLKAEHKVKSCSVQTGQANGVSAILTEKKVRYRSV